MIDAYKFLASYSAVLHLVSNIICTSLSVRN
jgi:hypothetical protein